ncbi:MAG: MFS transporter [Gemmatimonadales bacterium]
MAAAFACALPATHLASRARHHAALRLLPFLFVLYVANYLDRTSVAYAAIGMSRDLGFSDKVFGLGVGIFFLSYLALQIPGALLVERWSARRMISATMITWGSVTVLTALVRTPAQLYVARFLLGAAEAGFFPGVIVYLSHWFARTDRAKATSNFMSAIPISLVIGSPLAGWLLGKSWLALQGWRWLFIIQGAPAIVLGIVAYFYLTDWPAEAGWLAPEQREWITDELRAEKSADAAATTIGQTLRSRTVLLMAAVCFLLYVESYSLMFFFPTMLKRLSGLPDATVGLLGALPYVASFIVMQANGWHSDRTRDRRWHVAVPAFLAAAGLIGLVVPSQSIAFSIVMFTLATMGGSVYLPVFWAVPTESLSASAGAAAVGFINAIGSIGGLAGPYLFGYLSTSLGSFSAGLALMSVSALTAGLLMLRVPRSVRATAPSTVT